ncbi:MetQ/NlpA family ABC transporter substrate-binding protein [Paenalcaligenes niemegkensis]|uniref:MetQ/NlpA family ABC transporter substrate-binding protein n=1 Tax=Paenalcaligenes niemegkensis TaxID=2895469 RepID=UPI001EE7CF44|nr:MetQ/NlpA family ABC transporter substrate-binding protein [Paenalcaligenes niemegkensis]MCQ9615872.1 MetQ/NlpA family ABC transporter substrate-binding protein [Paenalcaligenes niemegkensis]
MLFKKIVPVVLLATALGLSAAANAEKLSIAATPVPHAELLEFIKPALAKQGVELDIKVFTDYVQPNQQVWDGAIDANFFQHQPYLDTFNAQHKTELVAVGQVHVEPFGAYSRKISNIDELKDGALVALPNDPSNGARALLLLQKQGLITLKDPTNILATARDISENPKNLKFREIEAATLPRVLPDVDLALINTNYALEAGLSPVNDALIIEGAESPYANLVAVSAKNAGSESVKKLVSELQSEATRTFINEKYQGAIVPAF